MVLPLLPLVSGLVIGGIKNAIKNAAKKVITDISLESVKTGLASAVLKTASESSITSISNLIKGQISDTQALLLNRLKSKPSQELYNLLSKDTGIRQSELKAIVKLFKQSAKANQLSKGTLFRNILNESVEKTKNNVLSEIGLKGKFNLKDLKRKTIYYLNDQTDDIKASVYRMLLDLQKYFNKRVNGISAATDKMQIANEENIDLIQYYNELDGKVKYSKTTLNSLEVLFNRLDIGFELGSDTNDVWVVEIESGEYDVYKRSFMKKFIFDFKSDVQSTLINTSTPIGDKNEKVQ